MDISAETCKDTYVQSCTPSNPPSFLPDCEDGWEMGNGTAVCATQQPASDPLPATGNSLDPWGALALALAAIVLGSWGVLWSRGRVAREESSDVSDH